MIGNSQAKACWVIGFAEWLALQGICICQCLHFPVNSFSEEYDLLNLGAVVSCDTQDMPRKNGELKEQFIVA